jgi:hypothetical protein
MRHQNKAEKKKQANITDTFLLSFNLGVGLTGNIASSSMDIMT